MDAGNSGVFPGKISPLKGHRALVIGGTGGIGRAVVLGLADRGVAVTIHGRSKAKADALARFINSAGGAAAPFVHEIVDLDRFMTAVTDLDVRTESLGGDAADAAAASRPHVAFDIIVVAYGPFVQKPLTKHSCADWQTMALMNLALPGALASRFLPRMMDRHFGRFLFFGGTKTDAIRAYRSNAAYAAAKTALGVLAKSIACEGASRDVAALVVCPGIADTEYLDGERRAAAVRSVQGGELLAPRAIAEAALSLLEAEPCVASGAVVSLDAGLTRWT